MTELRNFLGDTPEIVIVDFLTQNRRYDFTIAELKRLIGVSRPTLLKAMRNLLRNKLVERTRTIGKAKFYALSDNSITMALTYASLAHTKLLSDGKERDYIIKHIIKQTTKEVAKEDLEG